MSLLHRHCFSWYLLKCFYKLAPIHRGWGEEGEKYLEKFCFLSEKNPNQTSNIWFSITELWMLLKKFFLVLKSATDLRDLYKEFVYLTEQSLMQTTLVASKISQFAVLLCKTRYKQWAVNCLTGITLRQLLEYSADYCKIYKTDTELIRFKEYNCIWFNRHWI